jgi:hypothetical protein
MPEIQLQPGETTQVQEAVKYLRCVAEPLSTEAKLALLIEITRWLGPETVVLRESLKAIPQDSKSVNRLRD